jgi:hypothetical protein
MPPVAMSTPSRMTDPDSTRTPEILPGHTCQELTEPVTRALKASDLGSTPPVAETVDGVTSKRAHAHDAVDPTALLRSKGAASRGTAFPLGKDDKIPTPDRTHGRARQIQYTPG